MLLTPTFLTFNLLHPHPDAADCRPGMLQPPPLRMPTRGASAPHCCITNVASIHGFSFFVTCALFFFFVFSLIASLPVGLPFAILTSRHSPFHRGFYCNDDSIKFPNKEDTISYQLLGGVMIPVTVLTVSATLFGSFCCMFSSPLLCLDLLLLPDQSLSFSLLIMNRLL